MRKIYYPWRAEKYFAEVNDTLASSCSSLTSLTRNIAIGQSSFISQECIIVYWYTKCLTYMVLVVILKRDGRKDCCNKWMTDQLLSWWQNWYIDYLTPLVAWGGQFVREGYGMLLLLLSITGWLIDSFHGERIFSLPNFPTDSNLCVDDLFSNSISSIHEEQVMLILNIK